MPSQGPLPGALAQAWAHRAGSGDDTEESSRLLGGCGGSKDIPPARAAAAAVLGLNESMATAVREEQARESSKKGTSHPWGEGENTWTIYY